MNEYEVVYSVPKSGAGIVRERITANSDQSARNLVRAKFGCQEVCIIDSRQTRFGGGRDDQQNRR